MLIGELISIYFDGNADSSPERLGNSVPLTVPAPLLPELLFVVLWLEDILFIAAILVALLFPLLLLLFILLLVVLSSVLRLLLEGLVTELALVCGNEILV